MSERRAYAGWNPVDPLPWVVLTCPSCGRDHRVLGVGLYSHPCDCGAMFHRGFWTWTPPAEEELLTGGEATPEEPGEA